MSKITVKLDISKLKCASCKNHLKTSPVFIQYTGDSVCANCNNAATNKPSFRNKLYEEIIKTALFPCQYASRGCVTRVTFNNTTQHETVCKFRGCKCPIDKCAWVGPASDLFTHFFESVKGGHAAAVIVGQTFQFHKNGAVFKLMQVKNRNFVVLVNAIAQKICFDVINLFEGGAAVEYKLALFKPNARDEGEIRKKGMTRLLSGGKAQASIEYDKKLITEILGRSEMLECSIFLTVKD